MNQGNKDSIMPDKVKYYVEMQILNIIFSLSSVVLKLASVSWEKDGLFNKVMILYIMVFILLIGIYAFFWQKVIKKISLSTAYLSKGLNLFWTLLWAKVIFKELITIPNLIGTAVIFLGTLLVSSDEH